MAVMSPTDILKAKACDALERRRAFIDSEPDWKKVTLELFRIKGQREPNAVIGVEVQESGAA